MICFSLKINGLGLQERVRTVSLDSGVKPGSFLDGLCSNMDINVLILSTKSHNTKRTYLTPSNDGHILLSHKDTVTHHPIDLAVYAIKCAHGGVGLPDPTRNSYISSILEAA